MSYSKPISIVTGGILPRGVAALFRVVVPPRALPPPPPRAQQFPPASSYTFRLGYIFSKSPFYLRLSYHYSQEEWKTTIISNDQY